MITRTLINKDEGYILVSLNKDKRVVGLGVYSEKDEFREFIEIDLDNFVDIADYVPESIGLDLGHE
ncbi:hypothetical protein [Hutsoniella sourekii]|uniref:hypothetical protein n=1 Tax=Hutsoniella sourekii TaxID=87650 RepID=UPI0004833E4C|nr:hypothetical protein [Hutsoniella sourekii]